MRLWSPRLVLFIVLNAASISAAQAPAYKDEAVLQYAKSVDVAKLDSTLSSRRLEDWLLHGPAKIDELNWYVTRNCDLKDPEPNADGDWPLCVKIGFRRGQITGFGVLRVGTLKHGVGGQPAFQYLAVLSPPTVGSYDNLSDFPRYLDEIDQTKSSTRFAPTSVDLHKKYGKSSNVTPVRNGASESETFEVPPNITLVVRYGADGQACILELEPGVTTGMEAERNQEPLMSDKSTLEILEQAAPAEKRGKVLPGSATFCTGYPGMGLEDYENVYIQRVIRCTVTKGPASSMVLSDRRVRIWFKRTACPKPEWYPNNGATPPGK